MNFKSIASVVKTKDYMVINHRYDIRPTWIKLVEKTIDKLSI